MSLSTRRPQKPPHSWLSELGRFGTVLAGHCPDRHSLNLAGSMGGAGGDLSEGGPPPGCRGLTGVAHFMPKTHLEPQAAA